MTKEDYFEQAVNAFGDEKLHLGMGEIGVLFRIEMFQPLEEERRHPVRIAAIDGEGHLQEGKLVLFRIRRAHGDFGCLRHGRR